MKYFLFLLCVIPFTRFQPSAQERKIIVENVYFFGYYSDGFDLAKIRAALPVSAGQTMLEQDFMTTAYPRIEETVKKFTGHAPTDIALRCCTAEGKSQIYIGLQGRNYKAIVHNPAPQGTARLAEAASRLYQQFLEALSKAVLKGDAGEDYSQGYSLTHDPDTRVLQLAIRDFTLKNEEVLFQVLATASSAEQRQIAAEFLGYATQSQRQVDALCSAADDADEHVRNNAIRALFVIASADEKRAHMIPAGEFINLLNSGTWTDRNKGIALLFALTRFREPDILAQLRARAMPGLIEMARWNDGDSSSLTILGRVAGLSDAEINKVRAEPHGIEKLIAAALKKK